MLLVPDPYLQVVGHLLFHAPRQHLYKTFDVIKGEAGNKPRYLQSSSSCKFPFPFPIDAKQA